MQMYMNLLMSVSKYMPTVLLLLGSVIPLVTALGGLIKAIVAAFGLKGGKLDHLSSLCFALSIDMGKAKETLVKLVAGGGTLPLLAAVAAAALLYSAPARADGGCLGVANLHCGASASFMSVNVVGKPSFNFQPSVGPDAHFHWQKWDAGMALLNGGLVGTSGQAGFFGTLAPYACFGQAFEMLHGVCVGPEFDVYGSLGGIIPGWTWSRNFRVGFSLNPDLMGTLSSLWAPK